MSFIWILITFPYLFWTGGESSGGRQTRTGVAVCSQRRALLVAGIVLGSLLLTAIIIAYAGPQNGRFAPCPERIRLTLPISISISITILHLFSLHIVFPIFFEHFSPWFVFCCISTHRTKRICLGFEFGL